MFYATHSLVRTLENGVPVPNLTAPRGSKLYFSIAVPAGHHYLDVQISGGTGDADLYLRRGQPPTLYQYEARPAKDGNEEAVTAWSYDTRLVYSPDGMAAVAHALDKPFRRRFVVAPEVYFLMIYGYAWYSGVTLTATHH